MTVTRVPITSARKPATPWLLWLPRIFSLLFALFLSLFALDIFDMQLGCWSTIVGLAMHLIPTAIIVVILVIAWRWEWVGGVAYPLLGLLYIWQARGLHWSAYLLIAGPIILIGLLFWASWLSRRYQTPNS
jgi:hypothetical protein